METRIHSLKISSDHKALQRTIRLNLFQVEALEIVSADDEDVCWNGMLRIYFNSGALIEVSYESSDENCEEVADLMLRYNRLPTA